MPTTIKPFLWNYEVITYTDGTSDTSDPIVIGHYGADGADGSQGIGIDSIDEYYLATDLATGVTKNTTGWTTSVQTINANKPYLWNREVIHFSDGSVQDIQPCIIGHFGEDGTDGRGISSITEHYLASSLANVTRATSGWTTTPQTISASAQYLWNYETINFSDGTHIDTDPVIIGVYGVATAVDDLAFLRGVFGKDNVSGESGAILRNLIGVVSPTDASKVIAMLNASSIGEDSTHGKLLIAGGLDGLTAAGINAATFKVYADGRMESNSGVIGPFDISANGLVSSLYENGQRGMVSLTGTSLIYHCYNRSGLSGDFYVGDELIPNSTEYYKRVCRISAMGTDVTALEVSATTGAAIKITSGDVVFENAGSKIVMGGAKVVGVRKAVYTPSANESVSLDISTHHTIVVRQTGVSLTLPSSAVAGDEFEVLVVAGAATVTGTGISSSVTSLNGGVVTSHSTSNPLSLSAGYSAKLTYDGTGWLASIS